MSHFLHLYQMCFKGIYLTDPHSSKTLGRVFLKLLTEKGTQKEDGEGRASEVCSQGVRVGWLLFSDHKSGFGIRRQVSEHVFKDTSREISLRREGPTLQWVAPSHELGSQTE